MTLCPVAIAVGCRKCPVFAVCPVKGVIGDYKANTRDFQVGLDFVGCEFLKLHWCASPVCHLAIWPRRPAWGAFGGLRRLIAAKPRCAKGLKQPAQQPNSCAFFRVKIP